MKRPLNVMVGDVGGTNVRFALAQLSGEKVALSDIWKEPGEAFTSFNDAVAAYRKTMTGKLDGAAFGVAGPVRRGGAQLLHRDWFIATASLQNQLGVANVVVANDFMTMARSGPELGEDMAKTIVSGKPDPDGSLAVGGPGTGFGLAVLRRILSLEGEGEGWAVVGGEGGHQAFSPTSEFEWQVAQRLRAAEGYVSNELVASGSGFEATFAAVAEVLGEKSEKLSPADVEARAERGDKLCLELCRLRARTVMAALGDLVLSANATGGVFIAGGVSVKLERYLREEDALARFYVRGPRSDLIKPIPIRLITSEEAPLIGAAHLWADVEARRWL